MVDAIQGLIALLVGRLGVLSPFAKAVGPAVGALVAALVNMAFAGSFNTNSIVILAVGVAAALVTYVLPNVPASSLAPAPAPAPAKPGK